MVSGRSIVISIELMQAMSQCPTVVETVGEAGAPPTRGDHHQHMPIGDGKARDRIRQKK